MFIFKKRLDVEVMQVDEGRPDLAAHEQPRLRGEPRPVPSGASGPPSSSNIQLRRGHVLGFAKEKSVGILLISKCVSSSTVNAC